MKTVIVITYYAGANYGAYWQAYAIGRYLKKCGYQVLYLKDTQMENQLNVYSNLYEKSIKESLKVAIYNSFDITETSRKYDVAVLGSDEIWNRESSIKKYRKQYWGKGIYSVKKISYAACAINISSKRLLLKYNDLKRIDSISVRDEISRQNIQKVLHKKRVKIVIDPVFLITYDFVEENIINSPYIFVYSYGVSNKQKDIICENARALNAKIVVAGCQAEWADYNFSGNPIEWLACFKYAEYIYTTTFHGTAFSIIFKKEFSLLGSNRKAICLLQDLGLLINEDSSQYNVVATDYRDILKHQRQLIGQSVQFIGDSIDVDTPSLAKPKQRCSGCSACEAICPVTAIVMARDDEGFLYPSINADKCIRCGKCVSSCPLKKDN